MPNPQSLQVQQKKETATREERTVPLRSYVPITDIYETDDSLMVTMEVPGVDRNDVEVRVENEVLRVEANIDLGRYEGFEPLYTEYGVGHFARSFSLSSRIDKEGISAQLADGVLTLTLRKAKEAMPRRIAIS